MAMGSRVRRAPRTSEIWPGFVDALSTLLMVFIFLLVVFMLAQYFLSVALSGRDEALERLSRQVSELAELLSLERKANADLRLDVAQLSTELQSSTAARDDLTAQVSLLAAERDDRNARLATVLSERDALELRLTEATDRARAAAARAEALRAALAEAESTIVADKETIELKLAELASLRQDIAALREVRGELEAQVSQLAALLDESREQVASLEEESSGLRERYQVVVVTLGDAETALEELRAKLAERDEVAADLSERNRVLVVRLDEVGAALDKSRTEGTQLLAEYTALRDRAKALEARLSDQAERTALAQKEIAEREIRLNELRLALQQSDDELTKQRELSTRARSQVEILNQQVAALRRQLARIAKALELAEAEAEEQKTVIVNLGRRLNLALAGKVEELQRYRSEFFGRLREVLGNRPGIRIEGDRFVFQSEVLFASGSAVLEEEGQIQMAHLARTLIDIAKDIPDEINWIMRVDGHTDRVPIATAQFPSNWELSTARAISVVRFLTDQGVAPERLAATGFGEFQPLDPRDDEIAFRRNRRIELKLTTR